MMEMNIKIDSKEVLDSFDRLLSPKQRRSVLSAAKRAGGNVVRKRAAQLAPVGQYAPGDKKGRVSGSLRRSLKRAKTGLKITRRHKNVYVVAGLSDEDPYYARWVDQGHTIRRERRGYVFGHVEGRFFMERAARETAGATFQAFQKKFIERVYATLRKRNRRR